MLSYKNINGLMRHLRSNGIDISGSRQKTLLRNSGYYHGYKGYRFYKDSKQRIPFSTYAEIDATIRYDSKLKALIYGYMMDIETAVKNISLETILENSNSESIQAMFDKVISGYNNAPAGSKVDKRRKLQESKLNLQKTIQAALASEYSKGNPTITHFYNGSSYSGVPLWALFEIMTMGDFGHLLQCLTYDVRDDLSRRLGINVSSDTDRQLVYKYIYTLKDLRNAVAHNAVVFDTRFRKIEISKPMQECLKNEIGLPYVNFKALGDYIILMCYYLKLLHYTKTEIKAFIREFEKITNEYQSEVSTAVSSVVIHPDTFSRMNILKNYI